MKTLEVVTEHTTPFKVLFEVLKDMITETNIEFRSMPKKKPLEDADSDDETPDKKKKKEEKDCMRITAIDPTKTVLVHLKLDGCNFSKFICKQPKLNIGVSLGCFYKLIKSMGKNDILTLSVDHDKKNYLNIKIDSPDEKKDSEFNLKLLDIDETKTAIPDITFDAIITMDSQEFNKLCREMNNIADYVEIRCLPDKVIFRCEGDFADRKTTYRTQGAKDPKDSKDKSKDKEKEKEKEKESESNDNILVNINHASTQTKDNTAPQIVQGIFELKHLVLFSKCASLSNDIEIYMKNDFPLVIKYQVATLGRILLCLTPIKEDTTKNTCYSDEEEFYSDEE